MLSLAKRVVTVFGLGQSGGKQPKQKDNLFAPNIDDWTHLILSTKTKVIQTKTN